MNGDSNNLIVNSYSELIDIINKTSDISKEIRLKNITINFNLDFNRFLRNANWAKVTNSESETPRIDVTRPIVLDNVVCNKIDFINIVFESSICIYGINKHGETSINDVSFYDCTITAIMISSNLLLLRYQM